MQSQPGVLIVSCSNTKPKSLIKLLANTQEINESGKDPNVIIHPWIIDTKYYKAEVNLVGVESDLIKNEEIINHVEAVIIHMDSNSKTGLEDLQKWNFLDTDFNIDVKLLLANYCTDTTKINKGQALEWCLKRGFEFVELYPTIPKPSEDEIIGEKFGVERVREALQSHTWSNLVMKNKKKPKATGNAMNSKESLDIKNPLSPEHLDDFTELFSQLQTMKDSLQGMPMNQRKQCAEQMVTAFWKAIGGEEEELLDL